MEMLWRCGRRFQSEEKGSRWAEREKEMKVRVQSLLAAAALLSVTACRNPPEKVQVTVEHAWVRLPAAPGNPGAAYFTLKSNNDPTELRSISSPQVGKIELHETMSSGGMSHMAPLSTLQFPKDGTLEFKPGGKHAMLFKIDPAVKPGDRISFTFSFNPQMQITTEADVVAPGAPPPPGA
jgi:periplasmic copper chaperone A